MLRPVMYILFAIGAIVTMFIVYKDVKNVFAIRFVISYLIIVFFLALYFIFIAISNMRKLKWNELSKMLLKFIGMFVLNSVLILVLDYVFRPSEMDFTRVFYMSLGLSFGMTFSNLLKMKKCCQERKDIN